jgi:hypothetical protein
MLRNVKISKVLAQKGKVILYGASSIVRAKVGYKSQSEVNTVIQSATKYLVLQTQRITIRIETAKNDWMGIDHPESRKRSSCNADNWTLF